MIAKDSVEEIGEGDVVIDIPCVDTSSNFPPSSGPVFYNTHMQPNRDISVAAVSAFMKLYPAKEGRGTTYVDALAATGIRGIRIAKETDAGVVLNDISPAACEMIAHNVEKNGIDCEVVNENANVILHKRTFDVVDLDPFGTPVPFLDSAVRSTKSLLCVTATDTAPLCGAHKNSGIRTYAAVALNNEYHGEMGLRILLGTIARTFAKYDRTMIPLLTYASRHYVRTYVRVVKGAKSADSMMKLMGFVSHCNNCGHRTFHYGLLPQLPASCELCSEKVTAAGPLWLGNMHDTDFCDVALDEIGRRDFSKLCGGIVTLCRDEVDVPFFFDHHVVCKNIGISPKKIDELVLLLKEHGFKASRAHVTGTGFKTDARIDAIENIIKQM